MHWTAGNILALIFFIILLIVVILLIIAGFTHTTPSPNVSDMGAINKDNSPRVDVDDKSNNPTVTPLSNETTGRTTGINIQEFLESNREPVKEDPPKEEKPKEEIPKEESPKILEMSEQSPKKKTNRPKPRIIDDDSDTSLEAPK